MKKYKILATTALAALMLAACGDDKSEDAVSRDLDQTQESRMITDELGREVEIENTDRVVMGGILPYFSTWYVATNSADEIVGIHPNSYNAATHSVLKEMMPKIADASTNFIQNGDVNVEELLSLDTTVRIGCAMPQERVARHSLHNVFLTFVYCKAQR